MSVVETDARRVARSEGTLAGEDQLAGLSQSFFTELKRRFDEEPEKLPGTIIPRLADFFTAYEDRRRAEVERERAALEQAHEDPLSLILLDGLPLKRRNEILVGYAHDLRKDLRDAERAIQNTNMEP